MRKEFQQKLRNINKTQEDFDMAVIKNFDEIVERVKGFRARSACRARRP